MNTITTEPSAIVQQIEETEQQLIDRAQTAINTSNWTIGECAAKWTSKYARGRTDADFGAKIGITGEQVRQRRAVWERFGGNSNTVLEFPGLKWSHFYVAIQWDDATDCLSWACEMQATVAEMKAWRRAQRGEDLSEPSVPPESMIPEDSATGRASPPSDVDPVEAETRPSDPVADDTGEEGAAAAEDAPYSANRPVARQPRSTPPEIVENPLDFEPPPELLKSIESFERSVLKVQGTSSREYLASRLRKIAKRLEETS